MTSAGPDRARAVRSLVPAAGLFENLDWRLATAPLELAAPLASEIEEAGRVFLQFYRASQRLYRRSLEGKAPAWIAQWLDQGKPADLLELQRDAAFKNEVPRVIRPDLLLCDAGLRLTELDSVPGGIGLTAWLYEAYEASGSASSERWLGSAEAMLEGFSGIFGDAARVHLMVSEESRTYRPEMQWIAGRLGSDRPSSPPSPRPSAPAQPSAWWATVSTTAPCSCGPMSRSPWGRARWSHARSPISS